tara:strand:- start:79 stop:1509 length:1431 start_codon:yes stop_codon:yes gene_type:complete
MDHFNLYNSLSKKKEIFEPITPGTVKMYVCGPTVYDLLHVGNFRGLIFFNVLRNWLKHLGYSVNYVYNYTDIDDKIINKSKEENKLASEISSKFIKEFENDFKLLKISKASHNPKCTDYINDIISFISDLIEKKFAYVRNNNVFFSCKQFSAYGKLSGKNIEDLISGHRITINQDKENPIDFVLWKPSDHGEPGWESPWGRGRPGWHIECSVMANAILGDQIDIHGGGMDLIFPHHENEIAQSESKTGKKFAKYWVHNNFIKFDDQKMSKSLGNIIKARTFMTDYNPEILKYMILSVHYRSPINFSFKQIQQSIMSLIKIYTALEQAQNSIKGQCNISNISYFKEELEIVQTSFNNDINTPIVFAQIFNVIRKFNNAFKNEKNENIAKEFLAFFSLVGSILSLFSEKPKKILLELNLILLKEKNISLKQIETEIKKRDKSRKEKNYKESDLIRDKLLGKGIELKDTVDGTQWSVKL